MRPVDVLAYRDVLDRDLGFNETLKSSVAYTCRERDESGFGYGLAAEAVLAVTRSGIRMGEVYLVSEEMNELAQAACRSMPPEPFMPQDLPSTHGFMWIEGGVQSPDIRGMVNSARLFVWASNNGGVVITTWVHKYDQRDEVNAVLRANPDLLRRAPELIWTGLLAAIEFGDLPGNQVRARDRIDPAAHVEWRGDVLYADGVPVETEQGEPSHELSWFLAAIRLMQQTITVSRREDVGAKKVRRFDLKDTLVSVITLRHGRPGREAGESEVEWHHRWVVRGHWRHQPYKDESGGTVYRWIYINPFIKGPEGAPLKRSEKVNVWKR